MVKHKRHLYLSSALLIPLLCAPSVFAAKKVNLSQQPVSILKSFMGANVAEISRHIDANKTTHVRLQQTYAGHRIWGADAVLHIPASGNRFLNGNFYDGIRHDLGGTVSTVFTAGQSKDAIKHVLAEYQKKTGNHMTVSDQRSELIVYVDRDQKAHWAYKVDFYAKSNQAGKLPQKPNFIVDAKTLETYHVWDNVQTVENITCESFGGGLGGNKNMGKYYYDGWTSPFHLRKLKITRDNDAKVCSLENAEVRVVDASNNKLVKYDCINTDESHNDTFWVEKLDPVNGGYSPSADALFGGQVIKEMYEDWYDTDVLKKSDGTPMVLEMAVHENMDNAYWDGRRMTFGDGISMFYPLTSLGVASHEVSHGFTEQHSNLSYYDQSGGMNEAFSDMAAQAAELFAYGKSSYQIGPEIMKKKGDALRYMDVPSKDCDGRKPGNWCSIDSARQYYSGLDVHYSSGVYNRAYYTLATTADWDQRKAFDVMVKANSDYWTSGSSFAEGACGVLHAAKDLGYDTQAVVNAFTTVDVKTSQCSV